MYEPRDYRHWIEDGDLCGFEVALGETDLYIRAGRDLTDEALAAVSRYRSHIEDYIGRCPAFLTSLSPLAPRRRRASSCP